MVFLMSSLCLLAALSTSTLADEIQPEDVVASYLESAIAGEWIEAAGYWLPADVERANRLGTQYVGIPFKTDCASPIFLPGVLDGGLAALIILVEKSSESSSLLALVEQSSNPDSWTARYHLIQDADRWVLASPATAIGGTWPVTSGRYLHVHVQPGMIFTADQLAALDAFIEKTCSGLGLPGAKLEKLRNQKLDYYLCDAASVEVIAGAPTQGVALLPVDAVVTSDPFHQHELAHLLINYALCELPLYTLPVLQEGTAVHLGGRWGRSPAVMEELGRYVLVSGFVEIGDILTRQGFHGQSADLTYAPSGILAGYLLDQLGPEGFLALYQSLSGSFPFLNSLNSTTIQGLLESPCGLSPGGLGRNLLLYCEGLSGGCIEPGWIPGLEFFLELNQPGIKVEVFQSRDWVAFEIQIGTDQRQGIIELVDQAAGSRADYSGSRLFQEIYPNTPYGGQRAAIVFNHGEVGLYDFALDQLLAKYVHAFRLDPDFQGEAEGRLLFRICRTDFPAPLRSYQWQLKEQSATEN